MGKRPYNLYAGPAILPLQVIAEAQKDLLNIGDTGLSLLESSHRSPLYSEINQTTNDNLRELLQIPENYKILFLQGGASLQFGMIPMNFLQGGVADYVDTGAWSGKAMKEARLFGEVNVAGSSKDLNYSYVPKDLNLTPDAKYVHICSNETIGGIRFNQFPITGEVPLIADMSSEICSRKIDVSRFGMIYAGAQKNLGPAGVTIVIIRDDLLSRVPDNLSTMLKYTTQAEKDSNYNTPPVFSIYIVGLVLKWLKELGGLEAIEEINNKKAWLIYDLLDSGDFYCGTAAPEDRSTMNITFRLPSEDLEKKFIAEGTEAGFIGLKGHRSVGGCRASIYNAFPIEGVQTLVEFMKKFARDNS